MSTNCARIAPLVLFLISLFGCNAPPSVRLATAQRGTVESTVSAVTSGTVQAEQVAELAFGAVGRVRALNIAVGDKVTKGQILAEIENEDMRVALLTATSELRRRQTLFKERVSPAMEVERAQREFDMAQSAYEKTLIRAPYDGIIAEVNLELGQLSQITAVVPLAPLRIVDVQSRYVRVEIDEVDMPRVKVGLPVRLKILAVRREPFKGTVRKVVPYVRSEREQDRTVETEIVVDQEGLLLPVGASADVEIVIEQREDVLWLPSRVVLGRGDKRYVFARVGDKIIKQPVKIGLLNYDRTQIVEGLSAGEQVAMPQEGVDLVDGLKITVAES